MHKRGSRPKSIKLYQKVFRAFSECFNITFKAGEALLETIMWDSLLCCFLIVYMSFGSLFFLSFLRSYSSTLSCRLNSAQPYYLQLILRKKLEKCASLFYTQKKNWIDFGLEPHLCLITIFSFKLSQQLRLSE